MTQDVEKRADGLGITVRAGGAELLDVLEPLWLGGMRPTMTTMLKLADG